MEIIHDPYTYGNFHDQDNTHKKSQQILFHYYKTLIYIARKILTRDHLIDEDVERFLDEMMNTSFFFLLSSSFLSFLCF